MARTLSAPVQAVYSELVERCSIARLADLAEKAHAHCLEGGFVRQERGGRTYWYFQVAGADGRRRQHYVGPDSEALRRQIDAHASVKESLRERRQLVSVLKRAGLNGPDQMTGRVLQELESAEAFRLRAVVVGTVAYQTYSGLLGAKLAGSNTRTSDLDVAQFEQISLAVEDAVDLPFLDILKKVDPRFEPIPYAMDGRRATRYAVDDRFRVDILSPNRGPDRDEPVHLPALRSDAQPLRFLDFLLYEEEQAAILYNAGILVNVPAPHRYALHKLIVARQRIETKQSQDKARKDLRQASELFQVLEEIRPFELRAAWDELLERGPKWRASAEEALQLLDRAGRQAFDRCIGGRGEDRPTQGRW
jgi:hypothetical protein